MEFIVPHEKMCFRNFVLIPLQEISPEWKHPKSNKKIDFLIQELNQSDKMNIFKVEKS